MQGRSDLEIGFLFQTICRLAEKENTESLMQIIQCDMFIQQYSPSKNHPSPFHLLARKGNKKAINFLNNKFGQLRNILRDRGASLDRIRDFWPNDAEIIAGYGLGGHVELACEMINETFNSPLTLSNYNILIMGLARIGHSESVNKVLGMQEIDVACKSQGVHTWQTLYNFKRTAIKEYLQTENIVPIIELIMTEDNIVLKKSLAFTACLVMYNKKDIEVLNSILSCMDPEIINELCGQLNNKNFPKDNTLKNATLLHLLTRCDYPQLREILIDKAHLDRENLLNQASKMHRIMREKQVSYEEALNLFQCWSLPIATQVWFSQGIQLIKDGSLPAEIFLYISSFVLQVSDVITNNLFTNYSNVRCSPHSFFQPIIDAKIIAKDKEIAKNYENRFTC